MYNTMCQYEPIYTNTVSVGVYCHILGCCLPYLCCHDAVSVCSRVSIGHMRLALYVLQPALGHLAQDILFAQCMH